MLAGFLCMIGVPASFAGGDLVKFRGDILVEKEQKVNSAVAIFGDVIVEGAVDGDVVAILGSVSLGPAAVVEGNVVVIGGGITRADGASLNGGVVDIRLPTSFPRFPRINLKAWFLSFKLLAFAGCLGMGLLVVAIFPKLTLRISAVPKKHPRSVIFWGLLGLIVIVPLAAFLFISVIGIILIPLEILLAAIGLLLGYMATARLIGKKLLAVFKMTVTSIAWETVAGLTLLALVGLVPLVGGMIKAVVLLIGFGSVIRVVVFRD